jgi:hypothetical protein
VYLQDSKGHDCKEGKLDTGIDLNIPEHRNREDSEDDIGDDAES